MPKKHPNKAIIYIVQNLSAFCNILNNKTCKYLLIFYQTRRKISISYNFMGVSLSITISVVIYWYVQSFLCRPGRENKKTRPVEKRPSQTGLDVVLILFCQTPGDTPCYSAMFFPLDLLKRYSVPDCGYCAIFLALLSSMHSTTSSFNMSGAAFSTSSSGTLSLMLLSE